MNDAARAVAQSRLRRVVQRRAALAVPKAEVNVHAAAGRRRGRLRRKGHAHAVPPGDFTDHLARQQRAIGPRDPGLGCAAHLELPLAEFGLEAFELERPQRRGGLGRERRGVAQRLDRVDRTQRKGSVDGRELVLERRPQSPSGLGLERSQRRLAEVAWAAVRRRAILLERPCEIQMKGRRAVARRDADRCPVDGHLAHFLERAPRVLDDAVERSHCHARGGPTDSVPTLRRELVQWNGSGAQHRREIAPREYREIPVVHARAPHRATPALLTPILRILVGAIIAPF